MPHIELKIFTPAGIDIQPQLNDIVALIANYCVVEDGNSLSQHVHDLLLQQAKSCDHEYKFATVESCTGGMVASKLVHYAGSSAYLNRGLVTYSNQAKSELADVSEQTIAEFGAVSTQVAEQMAQGAVNKWGLDLAVSITGIAGPEGGSKHKPVGTVAFAIADQHQCYSQMLYLPNRSRSHVRNTAAAVALDMVRRYLLADSPIGEYSSFKRA